MTDNPSSLKIFIEAPSGEKFEADVPIDVRLSKLAADFFEAQGWPALDRRGKSHRPVVEVVDPKDPANTKRLNRDLEISEAGIIDGDTLRIFPESIAGCFLGDVLVTLANGKTKPIRHIVVGDSLLSTAPGNNQATVTKVVRIFNEKSDRYLTLNETLHVTESHFVWANGKWTKAGNLRTGDKLQGIGGKVIELKSISLHHNNVEVHNLYVLAEEHTFFAEGILVHNMNAKEQLVDFGSILKNLYAHGEPPETLSQDDQRTLDQKLASIGNRLEEIESLEERIRNVETMLEKIAKAFGVLGNYFQRIVFVPQQKSDAPTTTEKNVAAEVQIKGTFHEFDEIAQRQLIETIAEQTQTSPGAIKIFGIESGSVLVTLEMPEDAALRLMSLYLSQSSIIQELHIEKVELRPVLQAPPSRVPPLLPSPTISPIRILFISANPSDTVQLRLGEEVRSIEQALRAAEFRDRFDIIQYWATRTLDLQSCLLRYKPNIVHFSGHGSQYGEIILEDELGNSAPVSTRALSSLFAVLKDNIRCVVLNACYSEQQATAIANQIDCVVGMSKNIKDKSAINFATAFYQALGYGKSIKTAFELGSNQIDLRNLNEHDIPILLASNNDPATISFVG